MFKEKKVVIVMPAYNASKTLVQTYHEVMEQPWVDQVVVVDDASCDQTTSIAEKLSGTIVHTHLKNKGYGANQKSCYKIALEQDGDIIVMVHPDYQYTPKLIPAMVSMIGNDLYDCVIGSRILSGYALKGGMPRWKYISNRLLTLIENMMTGAKLSEYHTGYRAFSRKLLLELDFDSYSDDFVFDNQMLLQTLWENFIIAEVSCPTVYSPDSSSINFKRSVQYGIGCLFLGIQFKLARIGLIKTKLFQ